MKKFHMIVRAVIISDYHILLAHQKGADNTFLPGGHIEIGESAVAALKREVREELDLEILMVFNR
ncbi:MAG: NUDIX domain-containing protein [Clostridia bacterium]